MLPIVNAIDDAFWRLLRLFRMQKGRKGMQKGRRPIVGSRNVLLCTSRFLWEPLLLPIPPFLYLTHRAISFAHKNSNQTCTHSHNHWFHDIFQIFSFIVFLGQLLVGEGFELQISYWTHTFLCSIKRLLGNIERYNGSLWSLAKIHNCPPPANSFDSNWRIILRITRNICSGNGKMFLGWPGGGAFTWRWSTNSPFFLFKSVRAEMKWTCTVLLQVS